MSAENQEQIFQCRNFIIPFFYSLLLFCLTFNSLTSAQEKLSQSEKQIIIDTLCSMLEKLYPIPGTGQKTSAAIHKKYEEGKYSEYKIISEFVQQLNDDLESISKDGHLGIIYDPVMVSALKGEEETGEKGDSYEKITAESERWNNYGFKELKILEGNIGYLDLRTFFSLKYAGQTAAAAMNFFSDCNALIIDLRRNGGGWDDMVTFLASYFINDNDDIIFSITSSTLDSSYFASKPYVYLPGKKLTDIPLVILTSNSTASAAEAFTNIMKHFSKHASVIGETTAGAENPVDDVILFGDYILRIPTWKKIYSYDKSGWEGKGIKPDIEIESEKALNYSHKFLLHKLLDATDEETIKVKYQWYIDGVNAFNNPVRVSENVLQSYGGKYGNRIITYENGSLFYQYKGRTRRKMSAISNKYFIIEGYDFFRVKFVIDDNGVTGLNEIYDDGNVTRLIKE